MALKPMSFDTFDTVETAMRCLRGSWRTERPYGFTNAGVIFDHLLRPREAPQMLFAPSRPQNSRLMDALDQVNDRFGKKSLVLASESFCDSSWHLKAERWAPRYTTRLSDLPILVVSQERPELTPLWSFNSHRRLPESCP